jgi:hypothetical protein
MARRFQLPIVFQHLLEQVDEVVHRVVNQYDEDALVHIGMSALGRIHVIIVTDKLPLASRSEREELFWNDIEAELPADTAGLVGMFQVLTVDEALELHGPLDATLLAAAGRQLLKTWEESSEELIENLAAGNPSGEAARLLFKTTEWAHTASISRLSFNTGRLSDVVLPVRNAVAHAAALPENATRTLWEVPALIRATLAELEERVPAECAA